MRCEAASVTKSNSLAISRSSTSSTRANPLATRAASAGSASSIPARMVGAFTSTTLRQRWRCPRCPATRRSRQQWPWHLQCIEERLGENAHHPGEKDSDADHDGGQGSGEYVEVLIAVQAIGAEPADGWREVHQHHDAEIEECG